MTELERYIKVIRDYMGNINTMLDNIMRLAHRAEADGVEIADIPETTGKGVLKSLGDDETDMSPHIPPKETPKVYLWGAFTRDVPLIIPDGTEFKFRVTSDEEGVTPFPEESTVRKMLKNPSMGCIEVEDDLTKFTTNIEVVKFTSSASLVELLEKLFAKLGYETIVIYDWRLEE